MTPAPNGNGKTPWSAIETVDARQMLKARHGNSFVSGLWIDLLKRLEQTPRDQALTVTFEDANEGSTAVSALRRLRKLGGLTDQVEITHRLDGKKRIIYVRRGEKWVAPIKREVP